MKRSNAMDFIAVVSLFAGITILCVCFGLYLADIRFFKWLPLIGTVLDLLPFAYANLARDEE